MVCFRPEAQGLPVSICTGLMHECKCTTLQAVKEVDSLRAVVGNYEKDKAALTQSKARLLHSEKHLKHLEWENEVCRPSKGSWQGQAGACCAVWGQRL